MENLQNKGGSDALPLKHKTIEELFVYLYVGKYKMFVLSPIKVCKSTIMSAALK